MTRAPAVILNPEQRWRRKSYSGRWSRKIKAAWVSDIRKSHGNSPRLCSLGLPSMALEWPLLHFLLKAGKSNCYIESTCYSPRHTLGTDLHTEAQTGKSCEERLCGTEVTLDLSTEYGYWGPLWGIDALSSLKGEKDPRIFQAEGAMVLNAWDIQGTGTHRRSRSTGRRDQTGRLEAGEGCGEDTGNLEWVQVREWQDWCKFLKDSFSCCENILGGCKGWWE